MTDKNLIINSPTSMLVGNGNDESVLLKKCPLEAQIMQSEDSESLSLLTFFLLRLCKSN